MKNVITFLKKAWYHTWNVTKKIATFIRISWHKYYIGKTLWTTLQYLAMAIVVAFAIVFIVMKWLLSGGRGDK